MIEQIQLSTNIINRQSRPHEEMQAKTKLTNNTPQVNPK
jgi:hypothetical protein